MFKEATEGTLKVITANRLDDGLVVFLTADGGWSLDIAEARTLEDDALEEALTYGRAQHDARVVIEPYAIDVAVKEDSAPSPVRLRERIRADRGPTVAYGEAERAGLAAGASN